MRAVVVAGGTGGHIYPALAIINKIKEREPDSEILYFGTTDRMEKDIIPSKGIPYIGLEMSGLNRKNPFGNIKVLKKFFKAVKQAQVELQKFKPDVVIGVGGYITAPVLYAAHKLKLPVVIHEQNSIAGLSNQFIANFADKVFVSLPGTVKDFSKDKVVYTGNPRSEEIVSTPKVKKESLGFDKNKKLARKYIDMFTEKAKCSLDDVLSYLPILAASQSVKDIKDQAEFLNSLIFMDKKELMDLYEQE